MEIIMEQIMVITEESMVTLQVVQQLSKQMDTEMTSLCQLTPRTRKNPLKQHFKTFFLKHTETTCEAVLYL